MKTHTRSYIGERISGLSHVSTGYPRLKIGKKRILFHVVVFAIVRGRWPKKLLDHKDRNKLNSKIGNLREADYFQNRHNSGLNKNNISGYKGVSWSKKDRAWIVTLRVKHKRYYGGFFKRKDDAIKMSKSLIKKHHKSFRIVEAKKK